MASSDGVLTDADPADSLQMTLGLATAAVAVLDGDGLVTAWTPGAQRLLGYQAADVVGRPARRLLVTVGKQGDAAGEAQGAGAPDAAEQEQRGGSRGRTSRVRERTYWSGIKDLRHRDGGVVRVTMEAVPLAEPGGATSWFVWAVALSEADVRPTVRASVMRTLLDHAPVALAVWDTELRCVWLNTTAEHESHAFRHRDLGLPMRQALRGFDTDTVEPVMRQVLADGRPVIDHEFRWSSEDGTEERVFSSSFFRLDTAGGLPVGVCTIAVDITHSWARARLSMLGRAGRRVGTTLDVLTTAQELAEVTVPLLADFVAVDLADTVPLGDGQQERPLPTSSGTLEFHRAGMASIHEGVPESAWNIGDPVFVRPASPFHRAVTTGEPVFLPVLDASDTGPLASDPERTRIIRVNGLHSLMAVPLHARGTVLGFAVFGRNDNVAPFSRDDLLLAEELGLQASLSIDNARRYTRERTAALALQRNLLPRSLSGGATLDVASRYLPTDTHEGVGGDWFDVIQLSGGRVALVVGDVVGHGINAAATMGRFRTAVHTLADLDLPPAELLAHLDDLAVHLSQESEGPDDFALPPISATCVYAVYDPVTRVCTMARAGHPPPAVVAPDGTVTFPDLPAGAPIGLGLASYESVDVTLPEGSLIGLYTDGLVETRNGDLDEGLDRLASVIARPELGLETLCSEIIDAMTSHVPPQDDVALLVARTRVFDDDQVVTWELADTPAVVGQARALVSDRLAEWGLADLRPSAELIASELVTNAVLHGSAPVRLRLIRHASLVLEVADRDGSAPRLRHAHALDETGRGLMLVAELSRRWGCRFTAGGKITWAELGVRQRPSDRD